MKLSPWFYGLYEILERIGIVAYCLCLPSGARSHNVFHVSLLRKHYGPVPDVHIPLPTLSEDSLLSPAP